MQNGHVQNWMHTATQTQQRAFALQKRLVIYLRYRAPRAIVEVITQPQTST
jgi:hypothetical protein